MVALGILLLVVGLIWAVLGLANLVLMEWTANSNVMAFGLIGNMLLYILPGLVVAGIGAMLTRSWIKKAMTPIPVVFPGAVSSGKASSKKCPFCAETIKVEAIVCRFCGRDIQPPDAPSG